MEGHDEEHDRFLSLDDVSAVRRCANPLPSETRILWETILRTVRSTNNLL
jgi:hypothetical protein